MILQTTTSFVTPTTRTAAAAGGENDFLVKVERIKTHILMSTLFDTDFMLEMNVLLFPRRAGLQGLEIPGLQDFSRAFLVKSDFWPQNP